MFKPKIQTWRAWANAAGISCVYAGHPQSIGRKFIRRVPPLTRSQVLRDAGYRCVTGGGLIECSRLTDTRGVQLTPAEAVRKFVAEAPHEYLDVVYYPDPESYWDVIVWAK